MDFNLNNLIKALLFSTDDPISIEDIQKLVKRHHNQLEAEIKADNDDELVNDIPELIPSSEIKEAFDAIDADLEENNEIYRIRNGPQGYKMVIISGFAEWIRLFRNDPKPTKLTRPALETLAIISYRQPVTKPEMEAIRGVSVDSPIQKLLEYELVYVSGRAELPGKPLQYGTTDKFLELCGIESLDDLPDAHAMSREELNQWMEDAGSREKVDDKQMALPLPE